MIIKERKHLSKARRIVVKIGTSSLTDKHSRLDARKASKFVKETMELRKRGKELLVVTSGAIGAGIGRLGLPGRPRKMPLLQAAAAVGQSILMQVYEKYYGQQRQSIAQMLLSEEDFTSPVRYRNFQNTLAILLGWGVIPIINENDTVAVEEIRLGDNDLLSAYVAKGAKADLLVLLSDVNGLYTGDPNKNKEVKLIRTVERVTPRIEKLAEVSFRGFGGMTTKVRAAQIASEAGITVVIANSKERDVLGRIVKGEEIGTIFLPRKG